MKRELERIEIPGEHEARERSWTLVESAFAEREPAPRRRGVLVPALAVVAAAVLLAAFSPPGRAVLDDVRDAVLPTRVERAQPALFAIPGGGRVLVSADSGAWIVAGDGSKRLLGRYREASWSPFGAFVVAAGQNELVALEPDGDVRWSLSRPDIRFPRWGGTRTDTRIAYLSGPNLRVVGGDGKRDHRLARRAVAVAPAWRPGAAHVLTYARDDGFVRVVDADRGTVLGKHEATTPVGLDWVADRRLVVTAGAATLYDDSSQDVLRSDGRFHGAALAPRAQRLALLSTKGGVSVVEVVSRNGSVQRVFSGTGRFDRVAWSPDGRRLLVGWPTADQWVFVPVEGSGRIRAIANVSAQFRSQSFPRIEGWCCAR